jgi:UDP-N-acetylglucosamine transferase subunit ALG13
MIFVTVGTNETPFDRLVRAVDALDRDDVFVQYGSSAVRPTRAQGVDFLPFEDLVERVRAADVVVTHAGAGSVLVAIANGKRPIVMPRLHRFGEAVDDHQLWFARRFEEHGLAVVAEEAADLAAAAAAGGGNLAVRGLGGTALAEDLGATISAIVEARRPPRRLRSPLRRRAETGAET